MVKIWKSYTYFGTTVKNQHFVSEEIMSRLIRGMLASIPFRILLVPLTYLRK
jgi:hypothetical protein